jgi:hypothetical protein
LTRASDEHTVTGVAATAADFTPLFDDCRTPVDANALFKRLFWENSAAESARVRDALMEALRRALERMAFQEVPREQPLGNRRVAPRKVRNWARMEGIPLPRGGKVPVEIENRYREAQGMDLLPVKAPKITPAEAGVTPAEVRQWAVEQGIAVASRGRVDGAVVMQYVQAIGREIDVVPTT